MTEVLSAYHKRCVHKCVTAEQQVSAAAEVRGDEVTDELGPAGAAGLARGVCSQGRGCYDHSEIFQTGRA